VPVDDVALKFDRYMKRYIGLYDELASVVDKWSDQQGLIVDVGCGSGLVSIAIAKRMPHVSVVGVEPSEDMRKLALSNASEKKVLDQMNVVEGFSDSLPFEDGSIDCIVSRYSLPYWCDPQKSFDEFFRVLKPGGVVVLECLNAKFSTLKLWLIGLHMFTKRSGLGVARYHVKAYKLAYSLDQVKVFLKEANLSEEFVEYQKGDWRFLVVGKKPLG